MAGITEEDMSMSRKIDIDVNLRVIVVLDDGYPLDNFLDDMINSIETGEFTSDEVAYITVKDYDIIDSK